MKKYFVIFLFTLLIGLWTGGFFERYVFTFAFVQNFSVAEARELQGKVVKETCYKKPVETEKLGKVIGYSTDNYVFIRVSVKWDDSEAGTYTNYPKDYLSKCIEVVE